jgi:aspartate/methionine/tyrosine aminotransferase
LIDAVASNFNYYADSEGILELRQAIVKKESQKGLSITVEDVLVTNGISEGLDMVTASIVEPNSEI